MRRVPLLAIVGCAALLAWAGVAAGAVPLIYAPADAANAIHDGRPGVQGLTTALRQSPVSDDARWPLDRRVGKVSGRALSTMGAEGMVAALRAGWGERDAAGRVAIDEIVPGQWSEAASSSLVRALRALGPDAERVIVYASPALVAQAGRADPRAKLTGRISTLYAASAMAGRAFLEVYTGNLEPLSQRDMATYLTRWAGRWPAGRADRLHALVGPGGATGQAEIWRRIRASPAGRRVLANGPGAYGLRSAADGLAWLAAYREFLGAPTAPPPGGDTPVPVGGDVILKLPKVLGAFRPGTRFSVAFNRGGRAIVRLISARGTRRVIAVRTIPATGGVLRGRLPRLVRPGRYRLVVTLDADGLTDRLARGLKIGARRSPRVGVRALTRPA